MTRRWIAMAAAAAALAATAACSQPAGPGYGPGMMGGYGPGMMGDYGYGPGMMGGYGPGMMGAYGPGMMGGYGPGMMGPGMMGGYGPNAVADLTADQRAKISEAQQDFWKKQWPLMQQMHTQMLAQQGGASDDQAARRNYDAFAGVQKQMFENQLELRRRTDAVLTPQQRETLRRGWQR